MTEPISSSDHADLIEHATERTSQLLALAVARFAVALPRPVVRFDLRGRAAGQVRLSSSSPCIVRYNLAILARQPEDFLARTVPHEVSHLVVFHLHGPGPRPHGPEWRAIMQVFGADPSRCHDYDVSGLQTRRLHRYPYRCACRTHQLTSIRHNRARSGQVYLCRGCGQPLRPAADR